MCPIFCIFAFESGGDARAPLQMRNPSLKNRPKPIKHMKKLRNFPILVAGIALSLAFAGCHDRKNQQVVKRVNEKMEVKTISDTTIFSRASSDTVDGNHFELGAEVDFPTDGPQPLTDSVKCFATKMLHRLIDWDNTGEYPTEKLHIPFEEVSKWTGDNILGNFFTHYRPLYEKYADGAGAHYLFLKLWSQTDTYVTYYAEFTYCGGSCSHEYEFHTFRKWDGHRLDNVISDKDLEKFVKKYPKYEYDEEILTAFTGLSDAGFLYGAWESIGYFEIDTIPYSEIKSFLSKEAQELIPDNE